MENYVSAFIIFVPAPSYEYSITQTKIFVKCLSRVFLKRKMPYLKKVLDMIPYVWYNRGEGNAPSLSETKLKENEIGVDIVSDVWYNGVSNRKGKCKMKINFKEVFKQTLLNGGHTVEVEGRYMVALKDYEEIVEEKDFNETAIESYVQYKMARGINTTLGTWLHEGNVYLDTSVAFKGLKEALTFAKNNEQLAIFDTVELKEIEVE